MSENVAKEIDKLVLLGYYPKVYPLVEKGVISYYPEVWLIQESDQIEIGGTKQGIAIINTLETDFCNPQKETYLSALKLAIELCYKVKEFGLTFKNCTLNV